MFSPVNTLTGIPGLTVKKTVGATTAGDVALSGGVKYRVTADADFWIQVDRPGTAAAVTDMPIWSKVELPHPLVFGLANSFVTVRVYSTAGGSIYFTPLYDGTGTNL